MAGGHGGSFHWMVGKLDPVQGSDSSVAPATIADPPGSASTSARCARATTNTLCYIWVPFGQVGCLREGVFGGRVQTSCRPGARVDARLSITGVALLLACSAA
jgi:hypothetical protein